MSQRLWIFPLLVFIPAGLAGCALAPQPVYDVQHAALVQPPAPPMWSGMTRDTGFALGNSSVVWADKPELQSDGTAGLYVSSTQLDGTVHIDLGPSGHLSLWVPLSYGLSDYAFAVPPCNIGSPDGGTFSGGVGVAASGKLAGPWYLGAAFETLLAYIPAEIQATCVDNCSYADRQLDRHGDWTIEATLRLTVVTGFDFDWIRFYAGASLRNHHWNVQREAIATHYPEDIDNTVTFGRGYAALGGGLEVDIGDHVSLLAQVFQPVPFKLDSRSNIDYGPIVGATIDIHFPR